jgi:hypothetical protein
MAEQRFDGAVQLGSGLRCSFESVRWELARFARNLSAEQVSGFEHRREAPRKAGSAGMQRRDGQRNQPTGGHGIMPAPGVAARGVRIRATGSVSHCSLSYSDW